MIEDSDQDFTRVGSWHCRLGPGLAASGRLVRGLLSGQPDKAEMVERGVTALVTNAYRHGLGLTDEAIQDTAERRHRSARISLGTGPSSPRTGSA
ncbi:hypothetical protein [Actinomadura luteofluorescens]|uniref:hypothetical protein n=1 Tax=Actinomadura luteofluorescens TaxID=46163 RepID=UPI003D8A2EC9